MFHHLPTAPAHQKGGKRKLAALLASAVAAWAVVPTARSAIVNSVELSGQISGTNISVTATESVDVVDQIATISLEKKSVLNDDNNNNAVNANDTITYTFKIKNTGNVTLRNVALSDTKAVPTALALLPVDDAAPALDSIDTAAPGWFNLAPGDTLTATATYALSQADVNAGEVLNTASVTSATIPGLAVNGSASVTTSLTPNTSMTLVKDGVLALGPDNRATPGDEIAYTFLVTNTGTTTLNNVSINDSVLTAGLPNRDRFNALVQIASVESDPLTTATIATPSLGNAAREPLDALPDVPQVPSALHVSRRLISLSGVPEIPKVGDRVGVYFAVTNTGDAPLTNISIVQPGDEAFGNALEILAPNTSDNASIIYTHILTEEDIATSQVDVVSGISASSRNRTLFQTLREPLSLLDMETPDDIATASITPTNVPQLAPGDSYTFTATHNITQTEIDKGQYSNTATATADNDPDGATDTVVVPIPAAPVLTLEKTATLDFSIGNPQKVEAGDTITYHFELANTGNVTINDLTIVDTPLGISVPITPLQNFAPGDTQSFDVVYTLTPADIASSPREVRNQAFANGNYGPADTPTPFSQPSDDPATVAANDPTVTPLPFVTLVKKVARVEDTNANRLVDAGDTIIYQFTAHNAGTVPLTNVHLVDRDPNVVSSPLPGSGIDLAPGQTDTTSLTAYYIIRQADVDVGGYDNTADIFGTTPDGKVVTDESDPLVETDDAPTHVDVPQTYQVAVLKPQPTVVQNPANPNAIVDLGDILNYVITVVNTGNIDTPAVLVTDPVAGNLSVTIPSIPVGGQYSLNASHVVTAADMLAGEIRNTAYAQFTNPLDNSLFRDSSDTAALDENDPAITALVARAGVAVVKGQPQILDSNNSLATDAGDTLRYTFAITNTGNISLTNFVFTDILTGTYFATFNGTLEAGDTDTTTQFDYVLTAQDILNGRVNNRVTVTADGPGGLTATDSSHPSEKTLDGDTVTYVGTPGIAIIKSGTFVDVAPLGTTNIGDYIDYAFTVQNTGSQDLTNVTVTDTKATVSPSTPISLAAGATTTVFSGRRYITQTDINDGGVSNSATVQGFFGTTPYTDDSHPSDFGADLETFTPLTQTPRIAVVKNPPTNSDENRNGIVEPGETLTYTFQVSNLGNVPLYDVTMIDTYAVASGGPLASLAPGATNTTSFTATHLVTPDDATAGEFQNQAMVEAATAPNGPRTITDLSHPTLQTADGFTTTPIFVNKPVLTKSAARSEIRRGEQVAYTITATNLSAGTFDIADIMPAGFDFIAGTATANGIAVAPDQSGHTLSFANLSANAQGRIIVKLSLLASTSLSTGEFINRARIYDHATGTLLAEARAAVRIKEEHVFDCGEIIGRVFDDANNNGYMDEGEVGLPGVRVVTVKGLLITTDKYGRFHVTCADVPNAQIGSNFIMKLDPRTLPAGYALTTENPRDVRLTRGKITKLNFGASKQRSVALDLTRDAFNGNTIDLKPKFATGIDRLVTILGQSRGALTITYRCGQHAPIADDRVVAVEELIQAKWKQEGGSKPLKITTRVECGK